MSAAGSMAAMQAGLQRSQDLMAGINARVQDTFKSFQGGLDKVNNLLGDMSGFIGNMGAQVAGLVSKFSPGLVQQFQLRIVDTQAALGRLLIPAMEKFGVIVKGIGDMFASLSSGGQLMIQALAGVAAGLAAGAVVAVGFSIAMNSATGGLAVVLGGLVGAFGGLAIAMKDTAGVQEVVTKVMGAMTKIINGLGEAVQPVMMALMPIIDAIMELITTQMGVLASIIKEAVPYIQIFARVWANLIRDVLIPAYRQLAAFLGLKVQSFADTEMKDSTGMGIRSVRQTDTAGMISQVVQNALMIGKGPGPEQRTATNTEEMARMLREAMLNIMALRDYIQEIRNKIVNGVLDVKNTVQQFIKDNPEISAGALGAGGMLASDAAMKLADKLR